MDIRDGVDSVVTISISSEITLRELRNGGAELFAARLRERLEEELKLIMDIPWSRVSTGVNGLPAPEPPTNQRL